MVMQWLAGDGLNEGKRQKKNFPFSICDLLFVIWLVGVWHNDELAWREITNDK